MTLSHLEPTPQWDSWTRGQQWTKEGWLLDLIDKYTQRLWPQIRAVPAEGKRSLSVIQTETVTLTQQWLGVPVTIIIFNNTWKYFDHLITRKLLCPVNELITLVEHSFVFRMKLSCRACFFLKKKKKKQKSTLYFYTSCLLLHKEKKIKIKKSIRSTHSGRVKINTLPFICIKGDFSCSYSQ